MKKADTNLFNDFMLCVSNPQGEAGRDVLQETRRYIYIYDRLQRLSQPLLNMLETIGLSVSNAQEINRSAIKGLHATIYAQVIHPNAVLPECRIKLFCPLRQNYLSGDDNVLLPAPQNDLTHTSCDILIKPLGYQFVTTHRYLKGSKTEIVNISAPPKAALHLKTLLYRVMPDYTGKIILNATCPKPPTSTM